jgi:hypothetical protein
MIMGSGYRSTVDRLAPEARERVKSRNLDAIARAGISEIEANVVYAIARKPARSV